MKTFLNFVKSKLAKHGIPVIITCSILLFIVNLWMKPNLLVFVLSFILLILIVASSVTMPRIDTFNDKLIQAQKLEAIGEISAGIAHEINNPLAIIAQEIQWAKYCIEENPTDRLGEITDSLNEINRQIKRCKEITHKLLDFARKREPIMQAVNLNEVIEEMVKLVEYTMINKSGDTPHNSSAGQIIIEKHYNKSLPLICTDAPLIRQVVLNLLNNAVQAIGNNKGYIRVTTNLHGTDFLEFSVSDTGCGISPENLDKIFLPFFTTKPPGSGTGLGLFISYGIITRLGGNIKVESFPGQGTTFIVKLPIERK